MKAYNRDNTIEQFIAKHAKLYDPSIDSYFREPITHDVHTDKNEPLFDICSAAVYISQNYCCPVDISDLKKEIQRVLSKLKSIEIVLYATQCLKCGEDSTIQYAV